MKLLKKASISDILQNNVLQKYKEIELYTSWNDIDESKTDDITNILKENKAIIRAVHCPNSLFLTSNDTKNSTNYLSICEIINHQESYKKFIELLNFTLSLNEKQWNSTHRRNENNEYEDENNNNYPQKIILVLHSGCQIGCQAIKEKCEGIDNKLDEIKSLWKDKNISLVIENITPYYDANNNTISKGANCGWSNDQQWNAFSLAHRLDIKVCLDICHIFASHNIMNGNADYKTALNEYKEYALDEKRNELVELFHISNYDKKGQHGAYFSDDEIDTALIDSIRDFCTEIAPSAYATLEVSDGANYNKSVCNFERLMLKLSEKHNSGLFGKLLHSDVNNDINEFFKNLYYVYISNAKEVFDIKQNAMCIKNFVIDNTYINLENGQKTIFGFDKDSNELNLSLFRMQAYIYYTRFCNLGIYLAKYYNDNCIIASENKSEDFGLALKYFMFNDDINQVEFTGLAFHFNVNWLPRKETFYRFYDGIDDTQISNFTGQTSDCMKTIITRIKQHIENPTCSFLSCGKNFGVCLFKYWKPLVTNGWTVRVYKDKPINFIEYEEQVYSVQAFMQKIKNKNIDLSQLKNLSLDMSVFNNGRGDNTNSKDASSLFALFNYYTGNVGSAETVGSISDGEIIFLNLNQATAEYAFNNFNMIVLFKAYLERKNKDLDLNKIAYNLAKLIDNNIFCNTTTLNSNISDLLTDKVKSEKDSTDSLLKLEPCCQNSISINSWFKENYRNM